MFNHQVTNRLLIFILSLSLFSQGCATYRKGFSSEPMSGRKAKLGHHIIETSDLTLDVHSNNEIIDVYIVSFLGILPYFVETEDRPMYVRQFTIWLRIQPHKPGCSFDPKLVKLRINHKEISLLTVSGQEPQDPFVLMDLNQWTDYELTFDTPPPPPDQSFVLMLSEALNNAPNIEFHKSKWSEFVFHGTDSYIYGFLKK